MQLGISARHGDERLAYALNERTRELAASALALVGPADRTVAAEILVMRFVERFANAVNAADWTRLLSWVDATCRRYAGIVPVGTLDRRGREGGGRRAAILARAAPAVR